MILFYSNTLTSSSGLKRCHITKWQSFEPNLSLSLFSQTINHNTRLLLTAQSLDSLKRAQPDEKSTAFIWSPVHDKKARWQFLTSDPAAQQPIATGQYWRGDSSRTQCTSCRPSGHQINFVERTVTLFMLWLGLKVCVVELHQSQIKYTKLSSGCSSPLKMTPFP